MPAEPCAGTVVEVQSRVKEVVREADALTVLPWAGPCPGVADVPIACCAPESFASRIALRAQELGDGQPMGCARG